MEDPMVSGIQLVGIFFGLITSYFTFLHFKRQEFTLREFLGWELVWISFVAVTLVPEQFKVVASHFGAFRPLDFFTVIGFILVLGISFYTYVNVDRLNKKIEKTIRDLALQDVMNSTSKKK
jgi:hypothetical protein